MNQDQEKKHITIDQADIIFDEIKKAKKILMHCHPSPDADSLGSTIGLMHALKPLNKNITVIKGDSVLPTYLSALPGYKDIVLKNIFEVDLTDYDLFLILDAGSLNQISKLGDVVFPESLKTIVIDHHASNTGYADINLIDISYPATAQIIYDLIKKWGLTLSQDAALCLFAGIYTDTGGFRYKPANYKTLEAATELAKIAPNYVDLLASFENSSTKGRLLAQGLLLTSVETYFNDSVALAGLSHQVLTEKNISEQDISGLFVANMLKSVVGWDIAATLIEKEPGVVGISFRSKDGEKVDVSKIAVHLGGGGHRAAAGAQVQGTIEEAKKKVIEAISAVYPNLQA